MSVVMRYVEATRVGEGPLVAKQEDVEYMIVHKEAALPLDWDMKGEHLEKALKGGVETFIRHMELRGMTLVAVPASMGGNPVVLRHDDGTPMGGISHTYEFEKAQPDELIDAATSGQGPKTWRGPSSLEDSRGKVDYIIIGAFWAPKVSIEIAVDRQRILDAERAAKKQTTWGGGSTTPNRPSEYR